MDVSSFSLALGIQPHAFLVEQGALADRGLSPALNRSLKAYFPVIVMKNIIKQLSLQLQRFLLLFVHFQ